MRSNFPHLRIASFHAQIISDCTKVENSPSTAEPRETKILSRVHCETARALGQIPDFSIKLAYMVGY